MRAPYTAREDEYLIKYLAEVRPLPPGRQGKEIYQTLVENLEEWPWARTHPWQSWRERYKTNKEEFDLRIVKYQKGHGLKAEKQAESLLSNTQRNPYTEDEDKLLAKYLARYNPQHQGRSGNQIYQKLVENAKGKWKWSKTHSWHSWRNRYIVNQDRFDRDIASYQKKHGIATSPDRPERPAKRLKVAEEDSQESAWANLDWTPRNNHPPMESTKRENKQEGTKPMVKREIKSEAKSADVEEKKPVVTEGSEPAQPMAGSTRAGDDPTSDSDDEGPPPGSEDYGGEIFERSDEEVNGCGGQPNGDEKEDEDIPYEDPSQVRLDESSSITSTSGMLGSSNHTFIPSDFKPTVEPNPPSPPRSTLEPHPLKSRAVGNHSDFSHSSQYKPRRQQDGDPFKDDQSPPESRRKLQPVGKSPPKLVEGPFGNRLSRTSAKKADESETESDGGASISWPPLRGKASKLRMLNGTNAKIKKPRGGYLDATVDEGQRRDKGKGKAREDDNQSDVFEPSGAGPSEIHENEPDPLQATLYPSRPTGPAPSQTPTLKRRRTCIFLRPTPPEPSTQKRHSTGDLANQAIPQPTAPTSVKPPSPRIINFRRELGNKHSRHPTAYRAPSRISRASSIVSEEDYQIIEQLGIQQAIRMFSEQFGFTEAIIQSLWNQLKSLRLLEDALTEMKDSADRKVNEWIEGASRISSTGHSPMSTLQAKTRTPMSMSTPSSMEHASRSSSSRHDRRQSSAGVGMKSLEIQPVDMQDAPTAMDLEYEPLTGTRAGKFTRLVKMGREGEALEREQRRVSSIALSPRRDLLQQQDERKAEEVEEEEAANELLGEGAKDEDMPITCSDDKPGKGQDSDRSNGQEDDAMEVDSAPPDAPEEPPTTDSESTGHDRKREHDSEPQDHIQVPIVQKEHHRPQSRVDGEEEDELAVNTTASTSLTIEVEKSPSLQGGCGKWEEVESLLRAANRKNVQVLKELEMIFDPGFLMEWLGSQVILK